MTEVAASNDYPYHTYIKSPDKLNSSSKGTLTALSNDIGAISSYVDVLVSGNSKAQSGNGPLGNKYFLDTGGTCKDENGTSQQRFVYINNVPDGNIPLMSSAMGAPMKQFEGLVPGILEDLSYVNPSKLFNAFSESSNCQQITMQVKDISNNVTTESNYVVNDDISDYNACWFSSKVNPVTKQKCGSSNNKNNKNNKNKKKGKKEGMAVKSDTGIYIYKIVIGGLGLFILYSLLKKR